MVDGTRMLLAGAYCYGMILVDLRLLISGRNIANIVVFGDITA